MEKLSEVAQRSPAYEGLANYCFPNGTVAKCESCGKRRNATTSELAVWMEEGYPKCRDCGVSITIENPWVKR